ncbi:MAG: threonine synthase, partial [Bacteroidales bacterium]|nr:threonine synthase [Bacteroidales bacterium]
SYSNMSYAEMAGFVLHKFLGKLIPVSDLKALAHDAYNYDVPLEKVVDDKYIMRLDQGPTASFKDFAARMMGRLMQYFLKQQNRKLLILTATSGDTGSAIANAFYGLDNIDVVILYPENEVTDRQRLQMTTLQKNVRTVSLRGKFDDCQAMVKKAFADPGLDVLGLSSANSINIGRLLPQSLYYIYAYSRLCDIEKGDKITFSVPSGNFGNLMGGLLAMKMGLPVEKFVVSTNENDEVPVYFKTGKYEPIAPSLACISSAMNVGHPSNLSRIVTLYGGKMDEKGNISQEPDTKAMHSDMFTYSVSDEITKQTIGEVYKKYNVLIEPHGAVSWKGLETYLKEEHNGDDKAKICVSLETAHPAKFPKEVNEILGVDPELPASLKGLEGKNEQFDTMDNDYETFKKYLIEKY